jgi:hypothetical protein
MPSSSTMPISFRLSDQVFVRISATRATYPVHLIIHDVSILRMSVVYYKLWRPSLCIFFPQPFVTSSLASPNTLFSVPLSDSINLCKTLGSLSDKYKEHYILGRDVV